MRLLKKLRHLFQPKALVLMYHRIAELKADPWQLAVSPANFEQHLQVLKKAGSVISVKEMIASLENKAIPDNSICITFDDGYMDNYLAAQPLLERYQCPATFFIPTHYIGNKQQFWWDELENMLLHYPHLPANLSLQIGETLYNFDLGKDNVLTWAQIRKHESWVWPAPPPTRRCELYLNIWERIRPLPFNELQSVLKEIKNWASFKNVTDAGCFAMTHEQLLALGTHPFIDLGLHTETHPALSCHSKEVQHAEIAGNRKRLEGICAIPVETIAYPYGNYNATTLDVVKELGLRAAFTTTEKIVSNRTDPFQIGRFQVKNWDENNFKNRLDEWKRSPQFL